MLLAQPGNTHLEVSQSGTSSVLEAGAREVWAARRSTASSYVGGDCSANDSRGRWHDGDSCTTASYGGGSEPVLMLRPTPLRSDGQYEKLCLVCHIFKWYPLFRRETHTRPYLVIRTAPTNRHIHIHIVQPEQEYRNTLSANSPKDEYSCH